MVIPANVVNGTYCRALKSVTGQVVVVDYFVALWNTLLKPMKKTPAILLFRKEFKIELFKGAFKVIQMWLSFF